MVAIQFKEVTYTFAFILVMLTGLHEFVLVSPDNFGQYMTTGTTTAYGETSITATVNSINMNLGNVVSTSPITNFFGFSTAILNILGGVVNLLIGLAFGWWKIIDGVFAPITTTENAASIAALSGMFKAGLSFIEVIGVMYLVIDIKHALRL